jgi:hypothetical protein
MHKTDQSSLIRGLETHGTTLRVHFRKGGSYDYQDVPAETIAGLKSAESTGRYFLKEIRPNFQGVKADVEEILVTDSDSPAEPKP